MTGRLGEANSASWHKCPPPPSTSAPIPAKALDKCMCANLSLWLLYFSSRAPSFVLNGLSDAFASIPATLDPSIS